MTAALAGAIERFAAYLRDERRYSAATLGNYLRSLNTLQRYVETQSVARWRACAAIKSRH
jgi:site-specific recombinase XerC